MQSKFVLESIAKKFLGCGAERIVIFLELRSINPFMLNLYMYKNRHLSNELKDFCFSLRNRNMSLKELQPDTTSRIPIMGILEHKGNLIPRLLQ
jgi:hypothetical protein